jgi:acyl-CoA thioester hydrolase
MSSTPEVSGEASPMPRLARVGIAIRWRDLDAFNHVNNSTFLTYLEEARLQWLAGIGGTWIDEARAPVIAATQVNFRNQLQWPGEIVVELFRERVGTTSLTIAHRIAGTDGTRLVSDGHVVLVWIDPRSGRPVALPDAVRHACS